MARQYEKHGLTKHPQYKAWKAMRERCMTASHPDHSYYGQRGIYVCERWQSFSAFIADVGARPPGFTLDRENTDGPYAPDNCRWANQSAQQRNRRDGLGPDTIELIKQLKADGLTLNAIAAMAGVSYTTVCYHAYGYRKEPQYLPIACNA